MTTDSITNKEPVDFSRLVQMVKMRKKRHDQVTAWFYELVPELKPIADITICWGNLVNKAGMGYDYNYS